MDDGSAQQGSREDMIRGWSQRTAGGWEKITFPFFFLLQS